MKLNLKAKTIISIALFVVIFVTLILIASFCDFKISQLLTKGVLENGEYFAHDFFGVMLESVGCIPIYLMIAFILCVLFWSCLKLWNKKPYNIICAVVCAIGVVVACWIAIKDSAGYIFEHTLARTGDIAGNLEAVDKFEHSMAVYGVEAVFALVMGALAILATMHFNKDVLKKLLIFSLATAAAVALANVLIMIIKNPVGRMRFRAINSDLGQQLINDSTSGVKGFTAWYVSNGQPAQGVLESFEKTYGVTDAFKSFPSGHTCSAGTMYALIMIPTLFGYNGKKEKLGATIACWAVPVVYTMLVAISRIMVGAHYMSDVTFGGTLSFVCVIIAWEIFICKGSHFFALFPKLQKVKATDNANTEVDGDVNDGEEHTLDSAETHENSFNAVNIDNEMEFPSQADSGVDEQATESVVAESDSAEQ
ncbi:MAG: phosphatase PAP2 family protein [Clostridia bacterium]|nr:phosphatase PAP2 family protein [Clostridia bacterium]